MEEGMAKGMAKGLAVGAEQNRRATALRMKSDGMAPALIAKYTGLPIEEIEGLKAREGYRCQLTTIGRWSL